MRGEFIPPHEWNFLFVLGIPEVSARCMSGYSPAPWKTDKQIDIENKSAMNFLPVPKGSWQQHYQARNSKWNMMLLASTAALGVTVYVVSRAQS
jgi:hypothetical protein